MNVSPQVPQYPSHAMQPPYVPYPSAPTGWYPQPGSVPEPAPAAEPAPAPTVRSELRGAVLHVELDSPGTGNAVTAAMLDELLAVLAVPDPAVRVIVLSAAGRDFCLGGDRDELFAGLDEDPTGGGIRSYGDKARRVCDALTNSSAVTVARVQGRATGAGFALALACDLRVGADNAVFRLPELALGLPVAWGGLLPRLIHEVGAARVREIVLTGRPVGAVEARELAILQRVVPEEDLDAAVAEWTRPVTRRPEAALRVTKTLLGAHASATRLADASVLDSELMASVLAAAHYTRGLADRP
ncbi:enoyl-CoA hydratase/carnithine racemase [Kitasatospora sp. MAA19]|uniref:enoyl-CoA hydratase/isomerase family protein n=1 Tax=Kitasatospora sp. MAA19 TaxID=3035090 RepID=UPI0024762B2D|nr:enoyl-CoA hydratase/isomerase family protein [Kitasatospora sp. MAA19]MDH6707163.1 enoyl-CoA hydratase/carnithine racemase [Kitasatospora sp. MAA19]